MSKESPFAHYLPQNSIPYEYTSDLIVYSPTPITSGAAKKSYKCYYYKKARKHEQRKMQENSMTNGKRKYDLGETAKEREIGKERTIEESKESERRKNR